MSFYQQRCKLALFAARTQQIWGVMTGNNYHIIKGRCKELLAILRERIFIANSQHQSSSQY